MRSRSSSVTFLSSSGRLKHHWRFLALGCAAVGGVGVLWLPGAAQSSNAPDNKDAVVPPLPVIAPLPEMVAAPNVEPDDATHGGATTRSTDARPAAPSTPPAAAASAPVKINLEFNDVPVTELMMMIAAQGDVQIVIGQDVESAARVPYIRLNDVTPEDAIRKAALAANLRWKKLDEKTYFVGRTLPMDLETKLPRTTPLPFTQGIEAGADLLMGLDQTSSQRLSPMDALPYRGGLVPLSNKSEREERTVRPIRVRNVRPGLIAWWIDPQHQPKPHEVAASSQAVDDQLNRFPLRPAVDPGVMATLAGNASPMLPFVNPYATGGYNPYANTGVTSPWSQPIYRSNYLFGGGGGGFGGGGFGGGGGGFGGGGFGGGGGGGGFGGGGQGGGGVLPLPTDAQGNRLVDQIISIDAQNVLLVYGTAEGIQQLQTIIEYLDRPIRQVEIESQFIDVSVTDARGFGIQFNDTDDAPNLTGGLGNLPGALTNIGVTTLVFTRNNLRATLRAINNSANSRVITSPRVTTMNNLTATLQTTQQTPVVLTSTETGIGGQVGTQQNAFFLTTVIGISVTPTINNDDTITVFLTPQVSIQGDAGAGAAAAIPSVSSQSVTTVANVRDSDVIVLGGLRTRTQSISRQHVPILSKLPLIGRLFRTKNSNDTDRELVIFLTARILRRSEDITPAQGP